MSTPTITGFLEARIAEDERRARNASPGPWTFSDIDSIGGGTIYDPTVAIASVEWDTERVDPRIRRTRPNWQADATGEHIARHDPARVLAECAAKRALSNLHSPGDYRGQLTCNECGDWWDGSPIDYPCQTVKIVAAVYVDHPDYRQEWAV